LLLPLLREETVSQRRLRQVQVTAAQWGCNGGVDRVGRPRVVLLIDEYDAPITALLNADTLSDDKLLRVSKQRVEALSAFYSASWACFTWCLPGA
jgi:hypothetical protein